MSELDKWRRLRQEIKEAHESKAVEKLLNDENYLGRLRAQIMQGVQRKPKRASLRVAKSETSLTQEPGLVTSRESCNS